VNPFSFLSAVQLVGGLALFLYGMKLGADALSAGAGGGMVRAIARTSTSPPTGLVLGIGLTALTQSSSATAVILVSLVNASRLTLERALPILLGAGIGTSLTVQLIAFRIFDYSLLLVAVGAFSLLMPRRPALAAFGSLALGFGLVFYGMQLMSQSLAGLPQSAAFGSILVHVSENPILAVLLATLFTILIQSSGALIALLVSLAAHGGPGFVETMVPVILGANLGTSITGVLAALGARREAKRVSLGEIIQKLVTILIALPFAGALAALAIELAPDETGRQIAHVHTAFNLGMALLFIAASHPVARLLRRLLPVKPVERPFAPLYLDRSLIAMPETALEHARMETARTAALVADQLARLPGLFLKKNQVLQAMVVAADEQIDCLRRETAAYLRELVSAAHDPEEVRLAERLFFAIADLEAAGDTVVKLIVPLAAKYAKKTEDFSSDGSRELEKLGENLMTLYRNLADILHNREDGEMRTTLAAARRLDTRIDALKRSHLDRLLSGYRQSLDTSSVHLDLLEAMRTLAATLARLCTNFLGKENFR
jgi:phosphate:Na+ symporter